jgi:CheY-like chemotaxis protein
MSNIAILAVDDEKIILDALRIQLEKNYKNKFIIEYAESAEEALEVTHELVVSKIELLLVISDYQMPGMKGDEFVRNIKKLLPSVNIAMLTGQMSREVANELLETKIVLKVLPKPWQESDLINLINSVTGHDRK